MHRRNLLKGVSAVALLSQFGPLSSAGAGAAKNPLRRVRPSNSGWPSPRNWQSLKKAVGGNLIDAEPLFGTCGTEPESSACRDAVANIRNPFFIGDQPGGTQISGWLDAWTPAPSAYALKARSAKDVVQAVNFARRHNLRLVVKGAGHSYQGTSNAPDSLLIWMRAMNRVVVHESFVPVGCAGTIAPTPAVTAEAGCVWADLYDAVTTKGGRYVQGGGCMDVGVAGLIQSGGFGVYSKGFGTAAASLLEAEIVTADGAVRTVNAKNDPDLFWAIKGGGGGSWGVITRLTLRTHELPDSFGASWGEIKAKSDTTFRELIKEFFEHYQARLFGPHWGEQMHFGPGNRVELHMQSQGIDNQRVVADWKPFFDWIAARPDDYEITPEHGSRVWPSRDTWNVATSRNIVRDNRAGAAPNHGWWDGDTGEAGAFLHGYDSVWLPTSLLGSDRLVDAMFEASRWKMVRTFFNKGLAGAPDSAIAATLDTATNPAVTTAFALVIIADGEAPAYPGEPGAHIDRDAARKDADAIDASIAALREMVANPGSYVSESNYFNSDWRSAFWGENYKKLRAIKDKYDPDGLFFVHHGVGSEDWSADGFTRLV